MTDQSNVTKIPAPPPLPARASDWVRKVKDRRSINDRVEELHLELANDDNYLRWLLAVDDEQSIEGRVDLDRAEAARMIRDLAKTRGNPVANEKILTIRRAIGVVMGRYGESQREREQKQLSFINESGE